MTEEIETYKIKNKDQTHHHIHHHLCSETINIRLFSFKRKQQQQPMNQISGQLSIKTRHKHEPSSQPQQHKKQVRRRLHTGRPYQERLLNMAEARREIVTALKFHRAAMKQAEEEKLLQSSTSSFEHDGKTKYSRRNPRIYPQSCTNNMNSYTCNSPHHGVLHQYPDPFDHFSCSNSSVVGDNLNLVLPKQTLGLNLNLQNFKNLDTPFFQTSPSSFFPSSSSSSGTDPEFPNSSSKSKVEDQINDTNSIGETSGSGTRKRLHVAVDDKEMAEIRSIGEKHGVEWSDRMNLATSAWWFKFLKAMEIGEPNLKVEEDDGYRPFDEVMEFPTWLNANDHDSSYLQQHWNDNYCSGDYLQDPALPGMEIGEIEAIDGEWLA